MNARAMPFFKQALPVRIQGLSLIELMISLALGLLVIAAIGSAYLSSRTTFKQQDALGRMQENARYVFELFSNDIRMTGYAGSLCGLAKTEVTPFGATTWDKDIFSTPLKGYENAATTSPADSTFVYAGSSSDALTVLRADNSTEYVVNAAALNGAAITFPGTPPADGNVIVTGCGNAKPRQAFALAGGVNGLATAIAEQSRIMPLKASLYYIRANGSGVPSLYRKPGTAAAEELVEGIEDMQITYGVDTSNPATCADNDGGVDAYVAANVVESTVPCASAEDDWKKVLAVRVTLSMQSAEGNVTTATSGDRRLRKTFTTTIAVRNRL